MALFVDTTGFTIDVENDLAQPVSGAGLSEAAVADPTVVQIQYTEVTSGLAQDRLDSLVNAFPDFVVITGVDSTFVINGGPISNSAGVTFFDGSVTRIIYDVTQCGGSNYFVFDTGGNPISFPNSVLLGHEMAHAFQFLGGGPIDDEVTAETDEDNIYRAPEGLPLRDVNNHGGGCGLAAPPPVNGGSISCLIASAAYGSPYAPQLNCVRRLRDVVLRQSTWGNEFFERSTKNITGSARSWLRK